MKYMNFKVNRTEERAEAEGKVESKGSRPNGKSGWIIS